MTTRSILPFREPAGGAEEVGGKGRNLALMLAAGLPVPPGFCITSGAFREAPRGAGGTHRVSSALRAEVLAAYEELGRGVVAVRSSATNEDGAEASFAGQQETILGVEGDDELVSAVERCWHSLQTERARAYRQSQGISDDAAAMAVVVQRLIRSEISGVLFTRDPLDPTGKQMLIEGAWGLGEAVVSGRVMPDRFHVDRETGRVVDQQIHPQLIELTAEGEREVSLGRREGSCLTPAQLVELAEIGRKIEGYYGAPRDVEWAFADGRLFVLQARPITAAAAFELEHLRREEITRLGSHAEPSGTIWARYNLYEVLPEPTPLTWGYVKWFMSGRGGFGQMYRDLGFDPDPLLDEEGIFDLICGRPYVNLSREPKLYFADYPFGHDFQTLKNNPERAIYPTPVAEMSRVTWRFVWRLPLMIFAMYRNGSILSSEREACVERLRNEIFPRFEADVIRDRSATDLSQLTAEQLLARVEQWKQKTLFDFARQALRPSLLAATALAEFEQGLQPKFSPEKAAEVCQAMIMGVHPDSECDVAGGLRRYVRGEITREVFLELYGHRGAQEMELSAPRWRETPERLPPVEGPDKGPAEPEIELPKHAADDPRWQKIAKDARLEASHHIALDGALHAARSLVALRETAKHYLILGMGVMRESLLELDRRHSLHGGIFFLLPEELPRLIAGEDFRATIAARKRERQLLLGIPLPQVVFSDDLDAIGRPLPALGAAELKGTPVSMGTYEGEALVLEKPAAAEQFPPGFILVCPSTDPAWVPLFLRAKGLVMETGGVLSHGAIVAREFGIPAVAGLPDIHRQIRSGQRLRVDGTTGVVHVFE